MPPELGEHISVVVSHPVVVLRLHSPRSPVWDTPTLHLQGCRNIRNQRAFTVDFASPAGLQGLLCMSVFLLLFVTAPTKCQSVPPGRKLLLACWTVDVNFSPAPSIQVITLSLGRERASHSSGDTSSQNVPQSTCLINPKQTTQSLFFPRIDSL